MSFVIVLLALALLMFVAYRGFSVILFAPICAMLAVLLTDPALVPPMFSGVFMDKMVGFVKSYLPVFLLGAVFGKVIELSGFARSIVRAVIKLVGRERSMLSIVLVCALLTYGGVSLFVVVFAVFPSPRRCSGRAASSEAADPRDHRARRVPPSRWTRCPARRRSRTSSPPRSSRPTLGGAVAGRDRLGVFILVTGLATWNGAAGQRRGGEGYGTKLVNEPEPFPEEKLPNPWLAAAPLVIVGVITRCSRLIPASTARRVLGALPGLAKPVVTPGVLGKLVPAMGGALALVLRIERVVLAFRSLKERFAEGSKAAVAGALLAAINTASEYGFGAVIAALPGFLLIADGLKSIPGVLVNEAVTVTRSPASPDRRPAA